jgi:hypothetical protein
MIPKGPGDGQKNLTPEQLAEIRDCWGMGVSLRFLATQFGVPECELRQQLGATPRRAPEPPAGEGGLIEPKHIQQMAKRKAMLKTLREETEGGGNG